MGIPSVMKRDRWEGKTPISMVRPGQNSELPTPRCAEGQVAMDCVPRISRAQKMDASASMATRAIGRSLKRLICMADFSRANHGSGKTPRDGLGDWCRCSWIGGHRGGSRLGRHRQSLRRAIGDQRAGATLGAEFLELQFEESGEGSGGYAKVCRRVH